MVLVSLLPSPGQTPVNSSLRRGNGMRSSCSKPVLWLAVLILALSASTRRAYPQASPQLTVQLSNGFARLNITGTVGSGCTIQSVTNLSRNWQFVTNFALPSNPFLFVDSAVTSAGQFFYRLYAQQVPTNVVVTNMVWISPGTFTMGSPDTEAERHSWEGPQTRVTISQGFWMGKYEVTQGEYSPMMGSNPSYFTTKDAYGNPISPDLSRPVEQVSWNDAVAYCGALTTRERNAGRLPDGYVYRLPTEAEWEYACREGTTTAFHYGPSLRSGMANFYGYEEYEASIGRYYNPSGIYLGRTTSVGSYAPNAWGLYDMHGNVWEWCHDWGSGDLPGGSVTDPQGPSAGSGRVIRGGSWLDDARWCRSAYRNFYYPDYTYLDIGFRVVLAPSQP